MISTRLITLLALVASLPFSKSDVFDVWAPHITYPTEGTTWYGGTNVYVTWDISSAPAEITNPTGKLYLVQDDTILLQDELAWDFNLTDGRVDFPLPDVLSGQYQVVLFGDSGNFSPVFNIIYQ